MSSRTAVPSRTAAPSRPRTAFAGALAAARSLALAALVLAAGLAAPAQIRGAELEGDALAEHIRSHYTKYEARIPMRDGVRLRTHIYVPNDRSEPWPFLMKRTPYGIHPYGADRYPDDLGPHGNYVEEGYIFVEQDVRGKYMSEGEFVNMRPHGESPESIRDGQGRLINESTDTYDTIEWLLEHVPGHNGKVGLWGISYPGFYASAGAIDSHPALAAVSPQAPIADWFWDDMHHHGAFVLPLAFNFFSGFGAPRPEPTAERADRFDHGTVDGYQFFLDLGPLKNANERYLKGEIPFWNDIVAHPNYDEFWQSRNILPHLDGITAAMLIVGGWYDTEDLYGPLKTYRSIEEKNPGIWNTLIMGPWPHGGWNRRSGDSLGIARFGFPTSETYRREMEQPFFRHFLKGGPAPNLPEAMVFETGANRWRRFGEWPPAGLEARKLYLGADGTLAFEAPTAEAEEGEERAGHDTAGYDEYMSDPDKPVPYTTEIMTGWSREYITADQRFAARRPDVLVYETEVLEEDLTLAGPILADLWVSTSGEDSDWVVKVIDVFPGELPEDAPDPALGGAHRLVRADVMRGRFRSSYERPEPFVPNQPTRVRFELQDLLHTFKAGHRVMVQIQSTWFPFIDRNPGSWVENIFEADEEDFIRVTNRVYRTPEHPSALEVGVLPSGLAGVDEGAEGTASR